VSAARILGTAAGGATRADALSPLESRMEEDTMYCLRSVFTP
jgi:hypothetical protein